MNQEVIVEPAQQETRVPEYNTLENLNTLFYRLGKVTYRRVIRGREGDVERPLWLLAKRAELFHQAQGADDDTRKKVLAEARARDEIAAQYLNQGEVKVTLPGLGEQMARYTNIEPPEGSEKVGDVGKPPVFLIPGISNDIDCVGALAQEIPYQGRNLIVIGFPESYMGKTTKEFADAVEKSPDFGPHAEFYKKAINSLVGEEQDVELWGFSTGAPIVAQILNDTDFQSRTTGAALISPASCIDQSDAQLNMGVLREARQVAKKFGLVPKYTRTTGLSEGVPLETKEHRQLRERVYGLLLKRVETVSGYYPNAMVKEGGKITVVSGEKDELTKSYKAREMFLQNPQMKIIDISNGYHTTPLVEPERVVPMIFESQDST
jgi:hypothetical protein